MTALMELQNFINGSFVDFSGGTVDSVNPATGSVSSLVPDSGKEEVEAAVTAAVAAFPRYI